MPKPRKRLVSLEDTPYYHCISRCVRRAFLCGQDAVTGLDFSHRRDWIVARMHGLAEVFALDICAYAIMSNHYHLVLHLDPDRAAGWSDQEVAQRWLKLFKGPDLVREWLGGEHLDAAQLQWVSDLLTLWRERLFDLSWYMRCLNESIARMANREDHCRGRFWEGRFKSQALLDERALLACMAYVDLNPIRAGLARTPEHSDYTSIRERIRAPLANPLQPFNDQTADREGVPYAYQDYLQLVDWLGRAIHPHKKGRIADATPPILNRLGMDRQVVLDFVGCKTKRWVSALGPAERMRALAQSIGARFIKGVALGARLCPERG